MRWEDFDGARIHVVQEKTGKKERSVWLLPLAENGGETAQLRARRLETLEPAGRDSGARLSVAFVPAPSGKSPVQVVIDRVQPPTERLTVYSVDGNISNIGSTFGQVQHVRDPRLVQFALKFRF